MHRYLVLASASPRRISLLKKAGYMFSAISSAFEEVVVENDPYKTAETNAIGKAKEIHEFMASQDDEMDKIIVLAADTVVYLDGEIFGKPKNKLHAREMLKKLSGKTHLVITGYCVVFRDQVISGTVESKVRMNDLPWGMIVEYVKRGFSEGKAGAYGIQDSFYMVNQFHGSLNNIIGLPIETIRPIIDKFEAPRHEIFSKDLLD